MERIIRRFASPVEKIERICRITGKIEKLKKILTSNPSLDIKTIIYEGSWTPLHLCCLNGFGDCAQFLVIEKKVSVSPRLEADGATALHMASWQGNLETVKLLVEVAKASLTQCNKKGFNALHYCCSAGIKRKNISVHNVTI